MKKVLTIVMTLLLTLGITVIPVMAEATGSGNALCKDPMYCIESDEDLDALNAKLDEISKRQECEVVIYTTDTFDGQTPTEYADDFYDYKGYGWGADKSGILFLINPESREWAISTIGYGITAFTDAGQEYIFDQISSSLGEDDYITAFNQYADLCDKFLIQAHTGEPYDIGSLPGKEKGIIIVLDIIVGLIIGIIIAFLIVKKDKAALKTVRREAKAKNYQRQGSLRITGRSEQFLYNEVEKEEKSDSSGGSSTHTSSSGTTHGGSSGTF